MITLASWASCRRRSSSQLNTSPGHHCSRRSRRDHHSHHCLPLAWCRNSLKSRLYFHRSVRAQPLATTPAQRLPIQTFSLARRRAGPWRTMPANAYVPAERPAPCVSGRTPAGGGDGASHTTRSPAPSPVTYPRLERLLSHTTHKERMASPGNPFFPARLPVHTDRRPSDP